MQYVVNDKLAAAFMGDFYRALVAGCLIDEAVSLGRAAIRREALSQNTPAVRDWGVPVLYCRARDGCVFHAVSDSKGRAEAEQYFTEGSGRNSAFSPRDRSQSGLSVPNRRR